MNIPNQRAYIRTLHTLEPVSVNGTIKLTDKVTRLAHGYDEPKKVGNLERTNRRIWAAEATEKVHEQTAYKIQRFSRKQRRGK